jgi:hypothetical protein|tara:strand:- start:1268 stop:1378 length:111 start_codon:yes stop_codon:yes gene_type:complete
MKRAVIIMMTDKPKLLMKLLNRAGKENGKKTKKKKK